MKSINKIAVTFALVIPAAAFAGGFSTSGTIHQHSDDATYEHYYGSPQVEQQLDVNKQIKQEPTAAKGNSNIWDDLMDLDADHS